MDEHAALVVIDVQNDYCHDDGGLAGAGSALPFYSNEMIHTMVPVLADLVDSARAWDVPVLWVRTEYGDWTTTGGWLHRGEGKELRICEPGSWGAEWYGVSPATDEYVLTKHRYSPFINTPFETVLRAQDIRSLYITGVSTNVCVESTARDAFMRDFKVVVVSDCSATYDAEVHGLSLQGIRRHFGMVKSAAEVKATWSA